MNTEHTDIIYRHKYIERRTKIQKTSIVDIYSDNTYSQTHTHTHSSKIKRPDNHITRQSKTNTQIDIYKQGHK